MEKYIILEVQRHKIIDIIWEGGGVLQPSVVTKELIIRNHAVESTQAKLYTLHKGIVYESKILNIKEGLAVFKLPRI
jgi:hypothetical protein